MAGYIQAADIYPTNMYPASLATQYDVLCLAQLLSRVAFTGYFVSYVYVAVASASLLGKRPLYIASKISSSPVHHMLSQPQTLSVPACSPNIEV